jgi:hypothetical protein
MDSSGIVTSGHNEKDVHRILGQQRLAQNKEVTKMNHVSYQVVSNDSEKKYVVLPWSNVSPQNHIKPSCGGWEEDFWCPSQIELDDAEKKMGKDGYTKCDYLTVPTFDIVKEFLAVT